MNKLREKSCKERTGKLGIGSGYGERISEKMGIGYIGL